MKIWIIVVASLLITAFLILFSFFRGEDTGGFVEFRDSSGCLVIAGYVWNDSEKECIKMFDGELKYQVRDFWSCVDAGYSVINYSPRRCTTPGGRVFVEAVDLFLVFSEQLRVRSIEKLGAIPFEGFDPGMYLGIFPGLVGGDFNGSEAVGGRWVYERDSLNFVRENYAQLDSSDSVLTDKGIMQFYKNLQKRLGIDVMSISDIAEIFRVIEGGRNWDEDEIVLMRNMITGKYGCFGCNGSECIEPLPEMRFVNESKEFHCTISFQVFGERNEYLPLPRFFPSDMNCGQGQTGKYEYRRKILRLVDCIPFPPDLGHICEQDSDCKFGCFTTRNDISNLGCVIESCQNDTLLCEGIRGRCGPYGLENIRISASNLIKVDC